MLKNYDSFCQFAEENLKRWSLYSHEFVTLAAMIVAHESKGGSYRRQIGGGPALGIFQMEPETHNSVWDNSDTIHARALKFGIKRNLSLLEHDDAYSLWMARHYIAMDSNPLPKTPEEMAKYCKSYWNRTGAATPEKYMADWLSWKGGKL